MSAGVDPSGYAQVTVAGDNLFRVALRYLGDATQAVRIAQLNGITDFFIAGPITLALPPLNAAATGGVPAQ